MGTDCEGVNGQVQGSQRHDGETVDITATLQRGMRCLKKTKQNTHLARPGMQEMRCTIRGNLSTPGSNGETGALGGEDDCMMPPAPFEGDQM